jgi:ring-1,2-phenylacetyl-CoA epoxidase subunit PaaE
MSVPHFSKLTISDVRTETNDCVSIALNIPTELSNTFTYEPGQYVTFKAIIDGQEVRRSYSICSAPHEGELRVAIKQVTQGVFSTYANIHLKDGMPIEVMPPMGHFVLPSNSNSVKHYIGIASGSGITPVFGILKHVLNTQPQSTFTLIYGNKSVSSIIFKEQLQALKNTYMQRLNVIHILSRERLESDLNYGRINAQKCDAILSKLIPIKQIDTAFLCGPQDMIMELKDYLLANGLTAAQVKYELFGTNTPAKQATSKEPMQQGPTRKVSVKVDDRTISFEVGEQGDNILDAALKNGADLPYACKGGVCCTCRAKVVEGQVRMDVNYALEQDELDAGFVLTCQAHPITDHVVVDFDVR